MRSKTLFSTLAVSVLLALLAIPASASHVAQANDPVELTFDKALTNPSADPEDWVWVGTVLGDQEGTLTTSLTPGPVTGSIWHVSFNWIVDADDSEFSFTAQVAGILNLKTGRVVMNGVVVDGWLQGARIHIDAQLDFSDFSSVGVIRIMPSSADS